MAALLLAAQCLTLLLLGVMLANKHHSLLVELTLSHIEIQAADVAGALRTGALSGLRAVEMQKLEPLLQRLLAAEPSLAQAEIIGIDGDRAQVVFAGQAQRVGVQLAPDEWRVVAATEGFLRSMTGSSPTLTTAVRDGADEVVAGLRLYAASAPLSIAATTTIKALALRLATVGLVMVCSTLAALAWLRRHSADAAVRRRVLSVALVAMVAAGSTITWTARELFADSLRPAIAAKIAGIAALVSGKLERATALGIPLDQLPRVEAHFAEIVARHPEVSAMRLSSLDGRDLARHGVAAGEWVERTAGSAVLAVAGDARFVDRRLFELAADIAIVALVAVLVFRELLAALLGGLADRGTMGGAAAAVARLQAIRLPLFLFILTEELSRACLPLFLRSLAELTGGLRPETAVGIPIAVYMACFALATPFAGTWADRWGATRTFTVGVVLTIIGFAWTALAGDYWQTLPARALCALGYATATIACQRQLIILGGEAQRARAFALFVTAVSIAAICGTALGGVLADQLGFRSVFAASALLAALAWLSYRSVPPVGNSEEKRPTSPLRFVDLLRLLGERRFAALMFGSALPAKLALAGLLFYLTPLLLQRLGYTPAAIGRALMVYFVLVAAINPLASWLSDRYGWRQSLTIAGGTLIGSAGLVGGSGLLSSEDAIWLAIVGLGVGTGLASAAMQSLAIRLAATPADTAVTVAVRMLERLGSIVGPLWAGFWLAGGGPQAAMAALGTIVLAATVLCLGARDKVLR